MIAIPLHDCTAAVLDLYITEGYNLIECMITYMHTQLTKIVCTLLNNIFTKKIAKLITYVTIIIIIINNNNIMYNELGQIKARSKLYVHMHRMYTRSYKIYRSNTACVVHVCGITSIGNYCLAWRFVNLAVKSKMHIIIMTFKQ